MILSVGSKQLANPVEGIPAKFTSVSVPTLGALLDVITNNTYAFGVFRDGKRSVQNFERADMIGLDFDGGVTISEAVEMFNEYSCVIGPTRSHQKEKNGVVCDRFRVILFLDQPITDAKAYTDTVSDLMEKFPKADPACKDAARMFYKCNTVVHTNKGRRITPVVKREGPKEKVEVTASKGALSRPTLEFIATGALPGTWNSRLFKAAKDCHEQGYSYEETIQVLSPSAREGLGNNGKFDRGDLGTIKSAFNTEPKHDKRIMTKAFNFKTVGQLFEEKPKIDWLVDNLLSVAGISVVAGPPKSGKSTIIRQLVKCIARGESFLGRQARQGNVVYLALEEQEAMIYTQFKALGLTGDDPILIHAGGVLSQDSFKELSEYIMDAKPSIVVIDTLVLFSEIKDHNDYREVYTAITKLRELARNSGSHIVCIHHTNKLNGVMGSTAFTGAVDAIITFSIARGQERIINTQQRGGTPFILQNVVYDEKTQSYELGVTDDEF